jgi:REP element-mobilizing transposase RayT
VLAGLTNQTEKIIVVNANHRYYPDMEKRLIGYMITWTTYGSWLQGDNQRYVKNGKTLPRNDKLKLANQKQQKSQTVKLNAKQRQIAEQAILQEAQRVNQKVLALTIRSNHVHIVAKVSAESIEQVVHRYKYSATMALRNCGVRNKIWSRGFDKKFCFSDREIECKIRYIENHNTQKTEPRQSVGGANRT